MNAGGTATLTVVASGTFPLNCQWSFNSNSIAGATNTTLTLTNVQPANGGVYSITVSNLYGSVVSSNATLTVLVYPPTILAQPASQAVYVGNAAIFTVVAGGTLPLSYQWYYGTTNLVGMTNAVLTLTNVQLNQSGYYSVVITNGYGLTNSAAAVLTVDPAPPCDPPPGGLVSWWRAESDASDTVGGNNGAGDRRSQLCVGRGWAGVQPRRDKRLCERAPQSGPEVHQCVHGGGMDQHQHAGRLQH